MRTHPRVAPLPLLACCAWGAVGAQRFLEDSCFSSEKRGKILRNWDGAQREVLLGRDRERGRRENTRLAPTVLGGFLEW